jgi:hypothetical protein
VEPGAPPVTGIRRHPIFEDDDAAHAVGRWLAGQAGIPLHVRTDYVPEPA